MRLFSDRPTAPRQAIQTAAARTNSLNFEIDMIYDMMRDLRWKTGRQAARLI